MTTAANARRVDNIDDAWTIFHELMAAHDENVPFVLTPRQCAVVAQLVVARRSKAAPYLEAAVRQVGGRLHVDSRHLLRSTGSAVKYLPDHDVGHGGVLFIREDGDG